MGQALFKDAIKCGKASKKASTSGNNSTTSKDQFVAWSRKLSQLIGDENQLTYYVQVRYSFALKMIFLQQLKYVSDIRK